MKVYTKIVFDMRTLDVVEQKCFYYEGEIALCGGGSGSAGKIQLDTYARNMVADLLSSGHASNVPVDRLGASIVDHMHDASNPFTGVTAYDPDTRTTAMLTESSAFATILDALGEVVDWAALFTQANTTIDTHFTDPTVNAATDIDGDWEESQPGSNAEIEIDVDAYGDIVDDRVTTDVLPRFQRGMQDVNAVMTSAFTIGQAIIEGMADRDIAKYHGTLRVAASLQKDQIEATSVLEKNRHKAEAHKQDDKINAISVMQENDMYVKSIEQMVTLKLGYLNLQHNLSRIVIDINRMQLIAEKEEQDVQISVDEMEARWPFELFVYAGNTLAAASGATTANVPRGPTRTQSTIGGAMSGAATGAMVGSVVPGIGTGWGAGIGAVAGAYMGYTSAG